MRTGRVVTMVVCGAIAVAGCGGDDDSSPATDAQVTVSSTGAAMAADTTAAATVAPEPAGECPPSDVEASRTITVRVDVTDDSGFGSLGTRIPSNLTAGLARLEVEVAEDDDEPPVVTLSRDGAEVVTVDDVAPGQTCGVDIEVTAGDYTITFLDKEKTFTVVAG